MDRVGDEGVAATEPTGSVAAVRALWTQVKPPFMAPAVATALFGALLAPAVWAPFGGALHVASVACALYVAHLRDERVDAYVRGEETPSVPPRLLRVATLSGSAAYLVAVAGVWLLAGPLAAALTLPPFVLGVLHAPHLDTNPVAGTLDYPVSVGFVVAGGYATQTGTVPAWLVWLAVSFVFVLAGGGIALDRLDREFDAGVDKRTVPVVLGDRRSAVLSAALVALGGGVVLVGALVGPVPRTAALAASVPLLAALATARADRRRAVRVQMIAAYPFAAALFVATCRAVDCVVLGVL